jgi:tetratricopeptide (TPR) repeat protein
MSPGFARPAAAPVRLPPRALGAAPRALALAIGLWSAGLAAQTAPAAVPPEAPAAAPAAEAPAAAASAPPAAPNSALDATMFYQLLIGELEAQAGRQSNAFEVLLDAARRTRDGDLFQRAIELAVQGRSGERALTAAKAWRLAEPEAVDPIRTELQLLVALEQAADIGEPLRSLIRAMPAGERPALIAGVPRFLASLPDKALTLRTAEPALQPYTQQPDTRVAAWTALGRLALAADKPEQALAQARRALADDPAAPGPVLLALELMPRQPAAEVLVQGYLARPDAPAAMRLAYARALDDRQRLGEAAEQLALAVQQQPDFANAWMTLGAYRVELREPDAALQALTQYLTLRPAGAASAADDDDAEARALVYALMAQAYEQKRNEAAVREWLDKIPPERIDLSALGRRAASLARQGQLTEARALLRAAPAKGDPDARLRLMAEAQLLREHDQGEAAYDLLLGAVRQTPDDSSLLYELAMTAERLARFDDMEALLRRVMTLKPQDHHALNALGYSLADRNLRLAEAQQLLDQAARMAPNDPFITDSLGWLAFRQGRTDDAVRLLRQSMQARPHVEVAAHLGEVLWQSGQRDEAVKVLRDGQRRDADNTVLKDTLKRLQVAL